MSSKFQQQSGYYRFPDVHGDTLVFVSEDDLWSVPLKGGIARRLTANLAATLSPKISRDGNWVAYSALEEGYREIYIMPSHSGPQRRLTYLGAWSTPLGWNADNTLVYFCSNFQSPFFNENFIYQISVDGGEPEILPVGYANQISWGKSGACVIGRYTRDTARWKRYRGGRTGEIWIDRFGTKDFVRLLSLEGNITDPLWIEDRIYFISDHEGIGNIYSCNLDGKDVQRHTQHEEFYARNAGSDGCRIVYHAGSDIYKLDIVSNVASMIPISYHSSHTQVNRKFIKVGQYLQGYDISSNGLYTSLIARGKLFSFAHWSGPISHWGQENISRYRFPTWLYDSKTLLAITDEDVGNSDGEHHIVMMDTEKSSTKILKNIPLGIVRGVFASPKEKKVAVVNHRNQLILVDCQKQTSILLDTCSYFRILKVSWSPDSRWLVYDFSVSHDVCILRLCEIETKKIYDITSPVASDFSPVFSNDGKYIFFIGQRVFYPVYDSLRFDLSFIKTTKIYAILLQKDLSSPFLPQAKSPAGDEKNKDSSKDATKKGKKSKSDADKKEDSEKNITIDIVGIERRIIAFPIEAGTYSQLSTYQNKVFYLEHPRPCTKPDQNSWTDREPKPQEILKVYDLEKLSEDTLLKNINSYQMSLKGNTILVRQGNQLFVYKTGEKPKEKTTTHYTMEDGEIDLSRISVPVVPQQEWQQMYRETWILQREHFWTSNMGGVDWEAIFQRYWPILPRVGSRGEFSDLIWEMQGELGTSHCYEYGGDYRVGPRYSLASLGCDYRLSDDGEFYIIENILFGDSCEEDEYSPLHLSGIEKGDHLLAVAGISVNRKNSPRQLLLSLAEKEVILTIRKPNEKESRHVAVKTLKSESNLRYRVWVEKNRRYVHEKSQNTIGYLHIPDMGVNGFAEFYRYYSTESKYQGLIIDVRYNGGGHVSQLILEMLSRKPIGYKKMRWAQEPYTYPYQALEGKMIAITNQDAGSDGDIFSHAFKLLKLGKLIGKRTWGGVIGINGQYSLVDGTITTQPEYSSWFVDVGWNVENYGTLPDIEVDIPPKDSIAQIDTQLDQAIALLSQELQANPIVRPDLTHQQHGCSLPKLPKLDVQK